MSTLEWELLKQFKEQQKNKKELGEKTRREVKEAWEHLQKMTSEYENIRFREFQGNDVSEEKETKDKVDQARKAFENALEKQRNGGEEEEVENITSKDLIKDWNENILPAIKEKKLKSIMDKMKAARYSYCEALKSYYLLNNEYREKIDEVSQLEFSRAMGKGDYHDIDPFSAWSELPLIRQNHLDYIAYEHKLPKEIGEE